MVIKDDGTKWACQSCLKGHRVSGCNHTDRELIFVPKKGRPVTQCNHCRRERRNRSHHVRCVCGEKDASSKKCVHLQGKDGHHSETESHEHDTHSDGDHHALGPVPEGEESDEHNCCCHHGEKCRCSKVLHKQTDTDGCKSQDKSSSKPKLTTTASESLVTTTVKEHHHKAMPRNHSAHDVNSAYRVHKTHAVHGLHAAGRRSVDSLATTERSAKVHRPHHLHTLAPAPEKITEEVKEASDAPLDNSYTAFSIPNDYSMPSGHEELFANLQDTRGAMEPSSKTWDIPDRAKTSSTPWTGQGASWTGLVWPIANTSEMPQPALTYASSNTMSEFGEHTPPDEHQLALGDISGVNEIMHARAGGSKGEITTWEPPAPRSSETQQNRWSLPHSYWTNTEDNFLDLEALMRNVSADQAASGTQTNASYLSRTNSQGGSTTGHVAPTSIVGSDDTAFDQTMAGAIFMSNNDDSSSNRPRAMYQPAQSSLPLSSFHFNNYATMAPSNETYDFDPVAGDVDKSTAYQPVQNDPFFGIDTVDCFNINSDMNLDDYTQHWPS